MKLHLGSGQHPTPELPDWVDVDLIWEGVYPPDVHGDAFALPFRDHAFEAVYLGHMVEHIWWKDLPRFGAELRRVTMPGGEVIVVGPDWLRARHQNQPKSLMDAICGLPREGPGGHKWLPTGGRTLRAMRYMGLEGVREQHMALTMRPHAPNKVPAAWQVSAVGTFA